MFHSHQWLIAMSISMHACVGSHCPCVSQQTSLIPHKIFDSPSTQNATQLQPTHLCIYCSAGAGLISSPVTSGVGAAAGAGAVPASGIVPGFVFSLLMIFCLPSTGSCHLAGLAHCGSVHGPSSLNAHPPGQSQLPPKIVGRFSAGTWLNSSF